MAKHGAGPLSASAVDAYEAAVGVPQLIASAPRHPGVLTTGSPLRYFGPLAPAAIGGTAAVLIEPWHAGADRRAIVAATATLGVALGLSAYLIRSINIPLLTGQVDSRVSTADFALAPPQRRTPLPVGGRVARANRTIHSTACFDCFNHPSGRSLLA